jgi:hypothetical protein
VFPAGSNAPPGVSAGTGPCVPAARPPAEQLPLPYTAGPGGVEVDHSPTGGLPGPDRVGGRHPVAAWSKPAGRRAGARPAWAGRRIERRYETGEQCECEPCAVAGRTRRGYTRGPGLVACLPCWRLHERAGIWPTAQQPHDPDTCRLCRPSAEPADDDATAPMLGSLLPYNPLDRPLSASRPALADPWQAVAIARHFADDHAAAGRRLALGHDFGRVEVAVAEVYAALTVAYGPVVRPSVEEVRTRVGCSERRVQYALRALQRAGLLYQHADGCLVRGDGGKVQRLAAEYELRIPLAHLDRGQLMDELDEAVDRDRLDVYLAAAEVARAVLAAGENAEVSPATADPVDDHCTPIMGLSILKKSRSSNTLSGQNPNTNFTDNESHPRLPEWAQPFPLRHPRMLRGYALARRLQQRVPRWLAVPLPVLAATLEPLADLGWSAYRIDRATATFGLVTSSSGLTRTLRAVIDYVIAGPGRRDQARIDRLAKRIVAAGLATRAVWSDTSAAARQAYELAVQAHAGAARPGRPAGWDSLRALTDGSPSACEPAPPQHQAEQTATARRSAAVLARARRVAAAERARRGRP